MLFRKALALTVSALVCLTVFAPLGIAAASEPVHTVYKLPEYAEKATASNATAEDAKKFVQGVDWSHIFSDSDGGVNEQLFWVVSKEDAEKKPTFTIPLKIEKAGTYNVKLKMFVGGDFGKFSITLGGKTVTDSVDCFGEGGLTFFDFGSVKLPAGDTELVFTCIGYNPGNTATGCNLGISRLILSTPGYYYIPEYIGTAKASNATDNDARRFVQDMDRDWKALFNAHDVLPEDNGQLFWSIPTAEAGSAPTLTVPLNVPSAGKYSVKIKAFIGGDFGIFSLTLGGVTLKDSLDCFGEGGVTEIDLGEHELKAGKQELVVKCVGKNSALAADYCNFGITSLTLTAKPAPNPGTSDAVTAAVILGIAAAAGIALISEKHRS